MEPSRTGVAIALVVLIAVLTYRLLRPSRFSTDAKGRAMRFAPIGLTVLVPYLLENAPTTGQTMGLVAMIIGAYLVVRRS